MKLFLISLLSLPLLLLTGCGAVTVTTTVSPIATPTNVELDTFATQVAGTVVAGITQTAYVTPTETRPPTRTPAPTQTPPPVYSPDQKAKALIIDGNLYVQQANGENIQLTKGKTDHDPFFSDDGRKLVFYRDYLSNNTTLYAIDSKGGQEQLIINVSALAVQDGGQIKALTFIKNTHILLFNIYICGERHGMYADANCFVHTYIVDADSGKTEEIGQRVSGVGFDDGNFALSPNQKYLSIAGSGHINVFSFSAGHFKLAYFGAFTYSMTRGYEFLPYQYWLSDSSGLIIVSAGMSESNAPPDPPIFYDIFRLKLGQKAEQLTFKAIITRYSDCIFSISPDRNWILFLGSQTKERVRMPSLYLGNLRDSSLKALDLQLEGDCPNPSYSASRWSPTGQYYGYGNAVIGLDGSIIKLDGSFVDWIDATHYSYIAFGQDGKMVLTYIAEINGEAVLFPSPTPTP